LSDPDEQLLEQLRPGAFAVAYRMLGSVSDAEEVVQEALLRLHAALQRGEEIASPRAYVATVATRLAIDELRSARARRETYVGEWLPEPLVAEAGEDPASQAELADSLSVAFLVLLESLTPEERAVLVLHDVFDYGYGEVAEVIGKSEDNSRQLAVRARRHVEERRPRFEGSQRRREELGERFFAAAERGDLESLESLLSRDVVLRGDGGGKVPALARPLHGANRVARALVNWGRQGAGSSARMRRAEVNGQPGAIVTDGAGAVIAAMSVEVGSDGIVGVNSVVNPEKLGHLGPVGDMLALLRRPSS
jgi:RNA polymerase sigma-70 factor (ECF subfamily)